MSQKAPYSDFWHARHTCGHSVYWSDPDWAIRTSVAPCPWCGGETGQKVPADIPILRIREAGVMAFREKMPDGTPPWPHDVSVPETVSLHHAADESCCRA
jgi:hypothetical protein